MAHALPSELKDDTAPPRVGWERPPEEMGYVAVEDFRRLGGEEWVEWCRWIQIFVFHKWWYPNSWVVYNGKCY